ncbi:MAG TPA: DNA repair protein RecO [Blastocatellia bacterium]|nr:DNA repair protein RecO [Blastocatellia bacterium]
MPLHTTEAFVLRTYTLAEADKICIFLTKDLGKVRGVAHGARKMKSRFGSALEPFTEVALTYFHREGRELMSVSTCEIVRSHFHSAARSVETAGAFSYMAELLTEFLPDHEPNERLYRLVSAVLDAIECEKDLLRLLRYFESWLLRLVGYFPDASRCSACDERIGLNESAYLTAEGAPRCTACSGARGTQVDPALREIVRHMFRIHPSAFAETAIESESLAQIAEINYRIIRHALERDLKSRALLKQLSAV